MLNRIVSVHARIYGIGIYAIMLPSSGLSPADDSLHVVICFEKDNQNKSVTERRV